MYRTSNGERILLGAERRLFERSLALMVDDFSLGDCEFGVQVFDELQRGQKLYALYRAGRGLLHPDEPPPELTAYLEAAVASVYRNVGEMVVQEIEDPEFAFEPSWRRLILDAIRECEDVDELPDEGNRDREKWELLTECLEAYVLWDTDFENQERLDADPDTARKLDALMGIAEDYYAEVPHDPLDEQIDLYVDALAQQDVDYLLRRIASQANARLPVKDHIEVSPHVLRHTALRKWTEKKGVQFAQKIAGHASERYIWRYVQPSRDEMEEAVDELFD